MCRLFILGHDLEPMRVLSDERHDAGNTGRKEQDGNSLSLVAWELFVEEERVADAWEQMLADGLLKPAGRDPDDDEQLWRLTAGGWAARGEHRG